MRFDWSDEQCAFRDAVQAFAKQALQDDVCERDGAAAFSRELWQRCADFGIQGLPFPAEYGGSGMDVLTTVLAFDTLGSTCRDGGLLFALAAQMWSVQVPIWRYGTEEQKQRYLTRLCSGEWIGAHGMSEPDSGSDAFSLRTRAERRGDTYVLNGTKTFVSEAPVADLFLVFATTDRAKGALGITGFLVEGTMPGVRTGRKTRKMGLRTSPMSDVVLEDCVVPETARLGREGRGVQMFNDAMEYERGCILAGAVGAMDRMLHDAIAYARDRHQFGKPISEFQAVAHRIAGMRVRLDASRLLLYRAAWAKQCDRDAAAATAIAKLAISDAWTKTALDALVIRGGYGFTEEYQVERDLRDSIGGLLFSGTSDIQHNLIARALGL